MAPHDPLDKLRQARKLAEEISACLDLDSPSFAQVQGVEAGQGRAWYLIGLIGGKEVGKSALVNALVGKEIAAITAFGPGTEKALAYVHMSQSESLRDHLIARVGNRFELVEHDVKDLERQVLLDLPDMDSHFSEHVRLTREMVRWMEYPIWIASIEKYADAEPARLLKEVALGNSPENFIFCLNKVDQARRKGGDGAVEEIRQDYAERIARVLNLDSPPRVRLISALYPQEGDLPALRKELSRDKAEDQVERSRLLALERCFDSALAWIEKTGLPEHIARLDRFLSTAETELREGVGTAVYTGVIPRLEADGNRRAELAYRVSQIRAARWPFVNLLDAALGSLARLFQFRSPFQSTDTTDRLESLIEKELARGNPNLGRRLDTAYARIQSAQPDLFRQLFCGGMEWTRNSGRALRGLRTQILSVLERREMETLARLTPSPTWLGRVLRFGATFGAAVWFPVAQPLLMAHLSEGGLRSLPLATVSLLGVSSLLGSAALLGIYFVIIWVLVKWNAGRKVERLYARWRDPENPSPETSLYAAAQGWLDDQLAPIRDRRDRLSLLQGEYERLKAADRPENSSCRERNRH